MNTKNTLIIVGSTGLVISLVVNLLGIFLFHKAAAVFFTEQWWSSWFPSFLVWIVFLIIGLGLRFPLSTGASNNSRNS